MWAGQQCTARRGEIHRRKTRQLAPFLITGWQWSEKCKLTLRCCAAFLASLAEHFTDFGVGGVPCFIFLPATSKQRVPPAMGFAGCANGNWWNFDGVDLLFGSSLAACFNGQIGSTTCSQRTLLKTAKGCGTHFLGVASMKINSRKARDTRRRRREPESRMRCEIRSTTLDGAEYGAISQKGRAETGPYRSAKLIPERERVRRPPRASTRPWTTRSAPRI